jgi:hypothetical protein
MIEISLLDATAQADLVRTGEVSAKELVEAAIDRIEALNPTLNAVISTTYDEALTRAAGGLSGRLAGVPYLLKDLLIERAGTPFTEGSRVAAAAAFGTWGLLSSAVGSRKSYAATREHMRLSAVAPPTTARSTTTLGCWPGRWVR